MSNLASDALAALQVRAEERKARRADNPFTGYSHHNVRVGNMEVTRHFYEDIIGLPLTNCEVVTFDYETKKPTNYIYVSFEMADGSFLGFFQFADPAHPYIKRSPSYLDHLAIRVEDRRVFDAVHERVKASGYAHYLVPVEVCTSLYVHDPDGDLFEVIYPHEGLDDSMDRRNARHQIKDWLAAFGE